MFDAISTLANVNSPPPLRVTNSDESVGAPIGPAKTSGTGLPNSWATNHWPAVGATSKPFSVWPVYGAPFGSLRTLK